MSSVLPDAQTGIELWADRVVCWFLRHGVTVILFAMMVWVTLPFLAPVAFHLGFASGGKVIHLFYAPFCHQLPQRSWFLFGPQLTYTMTEITEVGGGLDTGQLKFFYGSPEMGWKVAWRDRMISFYFMLPVFGIIFAITLWVGLRIPPIPARLLLVLLIPLTVDGITHMISDTFFGISTGGFRDTNSWLALITGNRFPSFYVGDHVGTFNWWARLLTGMLAAFGLAFFTFPHLDKLLMEEERRTCNPRDLRQT